MTMGLHFANNAFLVLFVNTKGDALQTVTPFIAETPTIERAAFFAGSQLPTPASHDPILQL